MEDLSNSKRFIQAYNDIDYALRVKYDLKRSLNYTDVIRKTVPLNSIVRKFEDELIDFGRLRNAIVHSNTENSTMAEPHNDVVDKFEHIKELIVTPTKAIEGYARRDVLCGKYEQNIKEIIILMARSGYSNIPIYDGESLVGVANNGKILNFLGNILANGIDLNKFIEKTFIGDIVKNIEEEYKYFEIASEDVLLDDVVNIFHQNRKLLVLILTKNGTKEERASAIISTADLIDINNAIDFN